MKQANRILSLLINEYESAYQRYYQLAKEEHDKAEREAIKLNPKHKRSEFQNSAYDLLEKNKKEIKSKIIKELSEYEPLIIEYEFMHFFGTRYREEMNRLIEEAFTSLCIAKINKIISE